MYWAGPTFGHGGPVPNKLTEFGPCAAADWRKVVPAGRKTLLGRTVVKDGWRKFPELICPGSRVETKKKMEFGLIGITP